MTPVRVAAAIVLLWAAASAGADQGIVRVVPGAAAGWLRVQSVDAPLSRVLSAVSMRTGRAITLAVPDRRVTLDFTARTVPELIARIARDEGLAVEPRREGWELRDPAAPTVTMDVVDADLGSILDIVKKQCGIRNVIVDPGVTGKGTFLFRDVPCDAAIRTIFRSLGLAAEVHGGSIVRVMR
jgi:hypothetical protein